MIATEYHDRLSIFNLPIPLLKGEEIQFLSIINPHFPDSFRLFPPPIFHSSLFKLLLSHPSSHHLPPVESPSCCSSFVPGSLLSTLFSLLRSFLVFFYFFFATHARAVLLNYIIMRAEGGRKREEVLNSRGDLSETCPFCQLDEAWEHKSWVKNGLRQVYAQMNTRIRAHTNMCRHWRYARRKNAGRLYQFGRFNLFHMGMGANASAKAISRYEPCGYRLD